MKEIETIIKDIEITREEIKTLDRKMLIAIVIFSIAFTIVTVQIINLIDLNKEYVETLVEEANKRGGGINEIICK